MFEITDNGSGIDESKIANIFTSNNSDQRDDNYDGTGLGLNICRYLCIQTNGFIKYKSKPNYFTVFKYFIPIKGSKDVSKLTHT